MVIVTVEVADEVPSVAVTVNVVATADSVGVPEMTPVEVFSERPPGSDGDTANTLVPVIPVTVNAVVGVTAVPTVPVTLCALGDIEVAADAGVVTTSPKSVEMKIAITAKGRFMNPLSARVKRS